MRVTCQTGCSGAAWLPCEALTSKFHLDVMAQGWGRFDGNFSLSGSWGSAFSGRVGGTDLTPIA
jgi:hypothetical protein